MASSRTSASCSPDNLLDEPTRGRAARTSADESGDDVSALSERVTSRLRARKTLRDICKRYSIPDDFAPVLAGDLSSCSPPPPGSVCVYVDALDAGLRLPLHPFFGTVLSHFGLAPGQLAPNGWRALAGFVVLSHFAGVAPSLAVFRYFFSLCPFPPHQLYTIRGKDAAGLLFARMGGNKYRGWKEEFFFLSSAAPWPCPVEWGEPYRSATFEPTLTVPEKAVVEHLLRARGSSPIDLTTYLHDRNMAAAKIIILPPPTPQGMAKPFKVVTAAPAPAGKVALKKEPDFKVSPCAPSLGKKRKPAEEDHESSASDTSCPWNWKPSTSKDDGKQRGAVRDHHDGHWIAARRMLQGVVTPLRQRELAACRPADVVTSSYVSLLQTANEVAFSLGYALELEDKLRAREREADALRSELRRAKAELSQSKAPALRAELHTAKVELAQTKADVLVAREEADALRAELRRAKAEIAKTNADALRAELRGAKAKLAQTNADAERAKAVASRALVGRELMGYERGLADMKRAALHRYPLLDPASLVVRLHGPRHHSVGGTDPTSAATQLPPPWHPPSPQHPGHLTTTCHRDPRTSADDISALPERVTSRLRTRKTLRDICKKYSIPDDFSPVLAGNLSSCSQPLPGSVCVYVDALDAGLRLPLHPFFGTVLSHFGVAPGQLAPNGWRVLAGFVVLSHLAGEAPSLAVFRYFFALCKFGQNKLYSFRSKDAVGLLFGKLSNNIKGWKGDFFFLSSSAPWPCPVQWGEPSRFATFEPTLTGKEKGVAATLLRVRGGCPIDLTTYLHERNMTAATIIRPTPSPSQGEFSGIVEFGLMYILLIRDFRIPCYMVGMTSMEAPVNVTMEDVRAEKAAALLASARKVAVKTEADCIAQPCETSSGKRRKLTEGESSASDTSCPPGFSTTWKTPPVTGEDGGKQWSAPRQHREGDTGDWKAARQLLQRTVTPSRELELAASKPADVVASSYLSLLQTANEVAFSLAYALDLEDKLRARDREADALRAREHEAAEEADALRAELRKAKAELAETKAAAAREFLGSSREHARALAERELQGYERGMEDMKRAALRRYPNLDPARLVVPLHGHR
ncbi:hypothetical protein ACQ4PT_009035 [Festuca glaucescens]